MTKKSSISTTWPVSGTQKRTDLGPSGALQTERVEVVTARYYRAPGGTAAFRRGWALGRVAGLAFPHLAADARTVALAEQALAGDLPDPVRREVVDGLDQLRRAVASLERFAA